MPQEPAGRARRAFGHPVRIRSPLQRRRFFAGALAAAALLAACGNPTAAVAEPKVELLVRYDDGRGNKATGRLTCRGRQRRATGFLARRSVRRLCRAARELADFLARPPQDNRPCTEIYGGDDHAMIRGRVGSHDISRRFARRDGCEIADWERAQRLLPRPRGVDPP